MNIAEKISSDLTLEQQITAAHARLTHYIGTMAITFAVITANLFFILAYAPEATGFAKAAIAVMVIHISVFGALGGRAALVEIKAIIDDHVEVATESRYTTALAGVPVSLFSALTVGLVFLAGLVQLIALFAA